jgi:hypothetical protein
MLLDVAIRLALCRESRRRSWAKPHRLGRTVPTFDPSWAPFPSDPFDLHPA